MSAISEPPIRSTERGQAARELGRQLAGAAQERSAGVGQAARERSAELGQAMRDTVVGLDIGWAHGRVAGVLREGAGRFVLAPLMNVYTRRRVEGTEHLRGLKGPIVFVANHASHMDTPAILRALPWRWRRRTVVAAAADYFYRHKLTALAVSLLFNTVPIERRARRRDSPAMDHIDNLLDHGNSLLMFPEGTRNRSGGVGRLRLGAAKIATKHKATIVPIYIDGTRPALPPGRRWPRRCQKGLRRYPVSIMIGDPIKSSSDDDASVMAITDRISGFFEQARPRAQAFQASQAGARLIASWRLRRARRRRS